MRVGLDTDWMTQDWVGYGLDESGLGWIWMDDPGLGWIWIG